MKFLYGLCAIVALTYQIQASSNNVPTKAEFQVSSKKHPSLLTVLKDANIHVPKDVSQKKKEKSSKKDTKAKQFRNLMKLIAEEIDKESLKKLQKYEEKFYDDIEQQVEELEAEFEEALKESEEEHQLMMS